MFKAMMSWLLRNSKLILRAIYRVISFDAPVIKRCNHEIKAGCENPDVVWENFIEALLVFGNQVGHGA